MGILMGAVLVVIVIGVVGLAMGAANRDLRFRAVQQARYVWCVAA